MATGEGEEFVYRICMAEEWEELQKNGSVFGGDLDKSSGFIHLSSFHQVKPTLKNFSSSVKLGDGLMYEVVDGSNSFPHFYGPSRSFIPLPFDAVNRS